MKIRSGIALVTMICACSSLICFSSVFAASGPDMQRKQKITLIKATGELKIHLPSNVKSSDVDGVIIERNGHNIPIAFSMNGDYLSVKPSNDLEGGADYNLKIYTKSLKRYIVRLEAESFPKFDSIGDNIIKIPAKPSKGFNYAYYVYVPSTVDNHKDRRIIVNCNNTPPSNSQQYFDDCAMQQASNNTVSFIAMQLHTPCIVPAFPRYAGREDYSYAQILNRKAVRDDKIDKQLVAIIKDAKEELKYNGIDVADKVFLYGYSTDAKFAQRFTVIHPDLVMATVAGGVAGCSTLPMKEYNGEKLRYPVGVADVKELTGANFDKDEYMKVPQLFLMGGLDNNDATEWRDCYQKEDAEQIWRLLGRHQIPDRWQSTQKVLGDIDQNIKFKTYPSIGHDINNEVFKDIMDFFTAHWTR